MGDTDKNLQEAFAGESQANRRYLFFADKAEKEGYLQVARLFRAAAEAETVHAYNYFTIMDGVGSTRDNLLAGTIAEHYEFTRMYPLFIEKAIEEEDRKAELFFGYANVVEQVHHDLFQQALKALEAGQPLKDKPYLVCQVCGYTVGSEAPEKCLICNAPRDRFKRVE